MNPAMQIHQNPLFRKTIVPWWDADAVCVAVVLAMAVVFLFSISGIYIAFSRDDYYPHAWVPILLLIMSLGVLVSTLMRVVRRNVERD